MTTLGIVALIIFATGFVICWRLVTWHLVDESNAMAAPDDWAFALFFGLLAACVWPIVLIFWRPSAGPVGCPQCGATDRNCYGQVTSACGPAHDERSS